METKLKSLFVYQKVMTEPDKTSLRVRAIQGVLEVMKKYGLEPHEIECGMSGGKYVDVLVDKGFRMRFDTGYSSGSPENPVLMELNYGDLQFQGDRTDGHMTIWKRERKTN